MKKITEMKAITQVGIVVGGVVVFFIVCSILKMNPEQMGRLFGKITIPLIAFLIGKEMLQNKRKKKKNLK